VQGKAIYKSAAAMAAAMAQHQEGPISVYFLPPPPQFLFSHLRMLFNLHKQNKEQRVMDFITGELRVKRVTALCYLHLLHLFPSRQFLIQTRGS
jgi:hypothetical protein